MRRITQEEFNELCNGDVMSRLEDCIIGEEIEYPKKIHRITFKNCVFGKSFDNVELYQVTFQRMYLPDAFRNCKFYRVNFEQCSATGCMFENCTFQTVAFILCYVRHAVFDGEMDYVMFKLCDLYSSRFSVQVGYVDFHQCDMIDCYASNDCISFPQSVPSEGSFIAWKKACMCETIDNHNYSTNVVVKLRIPDDAERCSANHKCRANKVEVIQYETLDGEKLPDDVNVRSFYDSSFAYHIGMIEGNGYNSDPQRECGNGIHFFLNRDDAVNYVF